MKIIIPRILLLFVLFSASCKNDNNTNDTGNEEGTTGINQSQSAGSTGSDTINRTETGRNTIEPVTPGSPGGADNELQKGTAVPVPTTKHPFIIEGFVKNSKSETIILDKMVIGSIEAVQSQTINIEGRFSLDASLSYPEIYQLRLPQGVIHVPVHPNDHMFFTIDPNHIHDFKVEGSREPDLLREMYYILERSNERLDKVDALKESLRVKQPEKYDRLMDTLPAHYKRLRKVRNDELKKFINRTDTAFTAVFAALKLDPDNDIEFLEKVDRKFSNIYPHSPYYKALHEKVLTYAPIATGRMAPEIMSNTQNGNTLRLSSLKGKYVLVDFWASWCVPCKQEIPKLKEIYKKYKDKNFEILSVSLDNNRNLWLAALAQENMPWLHVSDLEGFSAPAAQTYLVGAIPATFLIDPQGRIIDRNFRADELSKKLTKLIF